MFENGAMPYWYDWGPEEADRLAGEIVAEKRPENAGGRTPCGFQLWHAGFRKIPSD